MLALAFLPVLIYVVFIFFSIKKESKKLDNNLKESLNRLARVINEHNERIKKEYKITKGQKFTEIDPYGEENWNI